MQTHSANRAADSEALWPGLTPWGPGPHRGSSHLTERWPRHAPRSHVALGLGTGMPGRGPPPASVGPIVPGRISEGLQPGRRLPPAGLLSKQGLRRTRRRGACVQPGSNRPGPLTQRPQPSATLLRCSHASTRWGRPARPTCSETGQRDPRAAPVRRLRSRGVLAARTGPKP